MADTNGNGVVTPVVNAKKSHLAAHYFKPGNKMSVGHGRPRSPLLAAIKRIEQAKGKAFLDHTIEQAFKDNKLIPPILDRIEPKLISDEERTPPQIVVNIVNYQVGQAV